MQEQRINLSDRAAAYGALAYLFAESIPGSSFFAPTPDAYEIVFRRVSLSPQGRRSLAKLIEDAADVSVGSEGDQVHISLRLAE